MTLNSTTTKVTYNGDGSTIVFAVSFVFWNNSDLRVVHRDASGMETVWTEGTHYTVTGGSGSTGSLTVETAPTDHTPAAGETLTIKDYQSEVQGDSLPLSGSFPSTVVEQRLDRITRLIQIHSEEIARSILLPETASLSGLTIPEPGAGELVRYNAAGTQLETVTPGDITTAIDTLLTGLGNKDFLRYDSGQAAWVNRTPTEARTDLGLGSAAVKDFGENPGAVVTQDEDNVYLYSSLANTGTTHPTQYIDRFRAAPAAGEPLGGTRFRGLNSLGAVRSFGRVYARCIDPAAGTEEGEIRFRTYQGGTDTTAMRLMNGLAVGGTSLSDPGRGAINTSDGYYRAGVALPIQLMYESAEQTITSAGALTLAHGLGVKPALVQCFLICKTAQAGYSVSDEVPWFGLDGAASGNGLSMTIDATNLTIRYGNSSTVFEVAHFTTGVLTALANTNWRLIVRAFA